MFMLSSHTNKINSYLRLIRFDKPIGTLLLLWPTLWGLWFASWIANHQFPQLKFILIFTLGTFLMRSAGCIINDFADRKFDLHVARTQQRPLTTGEVSVKEALILCCLLLLAAGSLLAFLSTATFKYALMAVALMSIYPFLKRITHLPQCMLGLAFAWGIPIAFAAIQGSVPAIGWMLFITAALWPIAYDTIYAMVDRDDDQRIGVKSTAILLGKADIWVISLLNIALIAGLAVIGLHLGLHFWYYLGLLAAAAVATYQHLLIRHRQPQACFRAFLVSHWLGVAVFVGIVLSFL